ncbi:hypothetical protein [uncultured Pseudomonas sp.]|uniref:hypothetical protein n=1 Tax=uncultured Pseudomonas sp. TaxID=114707 RepID=UPI0030DC6266|tara:strand:+ start:3719 stop:3922 length:204 start_codon:yes stop_codon:yes gene_type:complete
MYNNDPSNYLWMIGVAILVVVLLLDTDWKRRLFETYSEKLKRSEKFRNKEAAKYQKRQEEIKKLLNR